jgi:hypothetical protein
MKCILRLFTLGYVYLAFNLIPYEELGKATLCQTEGFTYMIPMLSHALAVWCCEVINPT